MQKLPDTVPFIGPETLERKQNRAFVARIGANESAFGISKKAQAAIQKAVSEQGCSWYCDPENHALRQSLSEKHNVSMENLCVDAGIDSLLGLTIRLFVAPGDTVVTSDGAYPTVNYHVNGFGGTLHSVPYLDNHEDTVALAQAARQTKARLVYLANPDNPMGTCVSPDAIQALLDELPQNCHLMLDEAYIEFMFATDALTLDINDSRLIRFRTFSKAYGLAGMRIGYAIANADIIKGYNRIRNHFGVNRLAQIAATESLSDSAFLASVCEKIIKGRNHIYALASSYGLPYLESSTNFVTVDVGSVEKADYLLSELAAQGVFIRKPAVSPMNRYIRIGIGNSAEQQYLEKSFSALMST